MDNLYEFIPRHSAQNTTFVKKCRVELLFSIENTTIPSYIISENFLMVIAFSGMCAVRLSSVMFLEPCIPSALQRCLGQLIWVKI